MTRKTKRSGSTWDGGLQDAPETPDPMDTIAPRRRGAMNRPGASERSLTPVPPDSLSRTTPSRPAGMAADTNRAAYLRSVGDYLSATDSGDLQRVHANTAELRRIVREELQVVLGKTSPAVLTTVDAAPYANRAEKTIREWCRCGALRAAKRGRHWVIQRADLDRFLAGGHKEDPVSGLVQRIS